HREARTPRLSRRAVGADARVGHPAPRQLRTALHRQQALSGAPREASALRALQRGEQCRVDSSRRRAATVRARRDVRRSKRRRDRDRRACERRRATPDGSGAQRRLSRRGRRSSARRPVFREPSGSRAGGAVRSRGRTFQSSRRVTPIRLTVVLTHPIQYYAPWFRHIARVAPEIALTVVHAIEPTPEQQGVGFDRPFTWDVSLTDGYHAVTVRPSRPGERI